MNGSRNCPASGSRVSAAALARSTVSVLALSLLSAACSDASSQLATNQRATDPAGHVVAPPAADAVRGSVVRYVLTMEDGTMQNHDYLRTSAAEPEQQLLFATQPQLEPGAVIDVWGESTADGIRVSRWASVAAAPAFSSGVESNGQALINDTPLRPRRFAFVLVDLGAGVRLTKAEAERKLFGVGATDASLRQWFIEASYGKQDISGEVFGPIKGTMAGCNFPALANSLRGQVPTGYDHYLWYFGSRVTSCGFAGVAATGTPARPQRDTWYNAFSDCVVLVQEPVHNFGTLHSSSMRCRNNMPYADDPRTTCTHNEYGDRYDPMGGGCRHMNGWQKAFQGWMGGCNVVDVNSSGTFTLLPIETACNGVQLLQIKAPKSRPFAHSGGGGGAGTTELSHYFVEYRTPVGFDRGMPAMVQVRVSGDIRLRTQRGFNTWFLDMNPATPTLDGLVAGGTFTDPAGGVTITVVSMDAKQAVIKVDTTAGAGGAPTCMDGKPMPTTGLGPESCNAAPSVPNGQAPPSTPVDGGVTPPTGSGGAGGGGAGGNGGGATDGGLIPVPYDASATEGWKDAGLVPPTGSGGISGGGAGGSGGTLGGSGGSGGSSGGRATGGAPGGTAPPATANAASGGIGCSVGGNGNGGGASFASGLGLLGLALLMRRRQRG